MPDPVPMPVDRPEFHPAEACRLAGVDVPERPARSRPEAEPERFREETELASRGWSW